MRRVNEDNKESAKGFIKLLVILLTVALVLCFRTYVIDRVIISGDSMEGTFSDGDICWVKKFGNNSYDRFDVVIANLDGKNLIKRVIGLPGEVICVTEGVVYINGAAIEGEYDFLTVDGGVADKAYRIPEGEYFLMGDNRQNSLDSRAVGSVSFEKIKGIVVFRFYPFTQIKSYLNS